MLTEVGERRPLEGQRHLLRQAAIDDLLFRFRQHQPHGAHRRMAQKLASFHLYLLACWVLQGQARLQSIHLIQGEPRPLPHRDGWLVQVSEVSLAQCLGQVSTRRLEPIPDSPRGCLDDLGDLAATVTCQIGEEHHLLLFLGQLAQEHPQLRILGPDAGVWVREFCGFLQRGHCSLAASVPQELAASDRMQPEPERGAPLELVQVPPGLHERLLGQVFRRLPMAGQVEQVAIDRRIVVADESVSRLTITVAKLGQEVSIGFRRRAILCSTRERNLVFGHHPVSSSCRSPGAASALRPRTLTS
jgi:hypothetical protein